MIQYKTTDIPGVFELIPDIYRDSRGAFSEILQMEEFFRIIGGAPFLQENESCSHRGVLRGMHLQRGNAAQGKLVRCVYGRAIDVIVDLRLDSPTMGKSGAFLLDGELKNRLYIPRGFAHGFLALSEGTVFSYLADNLYCPESEICINPFDEDLGIDWEKLIHKFDDKQDLDNKEHLILSEKDLQGIPLKAYLDKYL